jgi:hypothetical protein
MRQGHETGVSADLSVGSSRAVQLHADLSRFDCVQARARVCQLVRIGLSEHTVADLVGWSVNDVRRALGQGTK